MEVKISKKDNRRKRGDLTLGWELSKDGGIFVDGEQIAVRSESQ